MSKKLVAIVLSGSLALLVGSACGSSGGSSFEEGGDGGPGSSGFDPGSSSGTSGNIGSSGGGSSSGDLGTCAAETQTAKQLPLDIHIMLDASGSMMEQTTGGTTKWAAIKTALNGFIGDPKSAGIGVGLQIFPIKHPGAPTSCTTNAQCTVGGVNLGRCFLKACAPASANDPLRSCDTAADCPGGAACRSLGQCRQGIFVTGNCLVGDPTYGSCLVGNCQAISEATCDGVECVVPNYSSARVPIAALPGNASALTSTINSLPNPPQDALTPTAAAVQGGLAYSKQFASANPGHAVVMVLATDGLPTRCAPLDIPGIAALAAGGVSGSPSIKTFVIGVFSDAQKAQATANLNAIAAGGGTTNAFIVSTAGNVTQQFQQALEAIRGQALPCEYAVPKPEAGTPDYEKVNVQYTDGAGQQSILGYKASAQACDAAGGWYYDVSPAGGAEPTKIILCPATCDAVKKGTGAAKVDVLLGCKTIVK